MLPMLVLLGAWDLAHLALCLLLFAHRFQFNVVERGSLLFKESSCSAVVQLARNLSAACVTLTRTLQHKRESSARNADAGHAGARACCC